MMVQLVSQLLCVLAVCTVNVLSETAPTVTVAQGTLEGTWMKTRGGQPIAAFRGIPYAIPPVGKLRFKSPQPVQPWSGVMKAKDNGHRCVQEMPLVGIYGEEDCLFLNIYTPNTTAENKKLPVLFFIHGGAFKFGSGDSFMFSPKYLLDEPIVLVTPNYRLGPFGFLTLEHSSVPGNMGLKDQREALRWVRENIAHFGGDPDKVTLFGESAGAASVHYHMLFNAEEGLFRAGICHSGSALMAGAFQKPGHQKPFVAHLLNATDCQREDSSAVVECLQKIRPYKLLRKAILFFPPFDSLMRMMELVPVLEPDCVEDAFVTSSPWSRSTSLPLIIGTNQYDALFTILDVLKDDTDKSFEKFDKDYESIIPYNLMIDGSSPDPAGVARRLRDYYLKDNKIDREHVLQLTNLLSDGIFNYPATEAVKINKNKTYFYSFNYLGSKSFSKMLGVKNTYGPIHVDELFLFFPMLKQATQDRTKIEDDKQLSKQLVTIWTNFVANLKPTQEDSEFKWEPVSTDMEYLSINGPGNLTMDNHFYKERMNFWADLPLQNKVLPETLKCGQVP